jgi:hypothetical protein
MFKKILLFTYACASIGSMQAAAVHEKKVIQGKKSNNVALRRAAEKGDIVAAKAAIANHESIAQAGKKGHAPLHIACYYKHDAFVAFLIAENNKKPLANFIDAQTPRGDTALHIAARRGAIECMVHLLHACQHHKDLLNAQNKKGRTAVYLAARAGHSEVITLLEKAGADLNTPDHGGSAPLDIAKDDICKNLLKLNGAQPSHPKPPHSKNGSDLDKEQQQQNPKNSSSSADHNKPPHHEKSSGTPPPSPAKGYNHKKLCARGLMLGGGVTASALLIKELNKAYRQVQAIDNDPTAPMTKRDLTVATLKTLCSNIVAKRNRVQSLALGASLLALTAGIGMEVTSK